MISNELLEFIKKQRAEGVPDDAIRNMLIREGSNWTHQDISEAYKILSKRKSYFSKPIGRAGYFASIIGLSFAPIIVGNLVFFRHFNLHYFLSNFYYSNFTYYCSNLGSSAAFGGGYFQCAYHSISNILNIGFAFPIFGLGILGILFYPLIILRVAFTYRRLVDIHKKWYWLFLYFIPLVNIFFVFYLFFKKGNRAP